MDRYRLPQGVGDTLPATMYQRIALEETLAKLFFLRGYDPVDTGALENANTYRGAVGALCEERLFHFQDADGSMLVLRADMTLPISRIAAKKMPEEYPLRLSYISPSYARAEEKKNREREFRQAGVELYGVASAEADAEVVSLSVDALLAAGVGDFQIDMGQVGIVKGILKDFPEKKQLEIVSFVDKKNLLGDEPGIDRETRRVLNEVVSLFGGAEVLSEAEALLVDYPESLSALSNLRDVYDILRERGYERYLSLDLGLVNSYSYYSGVVFKGMSASFGDSLLGGGRYDRLLENYGKSVPATGMSIGIRAVTTAILNEKGAFLMPETDIAIGGSGKGCAEAARYAAEQRARGLRVSDGFSETREALIAYARRVKARRAVFFAGNGAREELL